jgi:hypothetical protein
MLQLGRRREGKRGYRYQILDIKRKKIIPQMCSLEAIIIIKS